MISAKIVADSKNTFGNRITTMVLRFPRMILAELNTHRVFTKNSASSRAIPFFKAVKSIIKDPFIPIAFQKDHPGMQGTEYLNPNVKYTFKELQPILHNNLIKNFKDENGDWDEDYLQIDEALNKYVLPILSNSDEGFTASEWWLKVRDLVLAAAILMYSMGVTKQLCNRLLEPFMWHTVIVTATEWENFFDLRCPKYQVVEDSKFGFPTYFRSKRDSIVAIPQLDINHKELWLKVNKGQAEIHMMALAEAMWDAMNESIPKQLQPGDWHIPFGDKFDEDRIKQAIDTLKIPRIAPILEEIKLKIATARCARVSYLNYEGKDDYVADLRLFDSLANSKHASPFEHCAQSMDYDNYYNHLRIWPDHTAEKFYWEPSGKYRQPNKSEIGWCRNFKGFIQLRATMNL